MKRGEPTGMNGKTIAITIIAVAIIATAVWFSPFANASTKQKTSLGTITVDEQAIHLCGGDKLCPFPIHWCPETDFAIPDVNENYVNGHGTANSFLSFTLSNPEGAAFNHWELLNHSAQGTKTRAVETTPLTQPNGTAIRQWQTETYTTIESAFQKINLTDFQFKAGECYDLRAMFRKTAYTIKASVKIGGLGGMDFDPTWTTGFLYGDLSKNFSKSNGAGAVFLFQYQYANDTIANMTNQTTQPSTECATHGNGGSTWSMIAGESICSGKPQFCVGPYANPQFSQNTWCAAGGFRRGIITFPVPESTNYSIIGYGQCKGGQFCGDGNGIMMVFAKGFTASTANLNATTFVQNISITGTSNTTFNVSFNNMNAGEQIRVYFDNNAGEAYDWMNFTLQVTGLHQETSTATPTPEDATPQPMTIWGYLTGANNATIGNVTAYINGVQKGTFNVTTTGQYGLFDVQGNATDYNQTVTLYPNNNTATSNATKYVYGKTERIDIPT